MFLCLISDNFSSCFFKAPLIRDHSPINRYEKLLCWYINRWNLINVSSNILSFINVLSNILSLERGSSQLPDVSFVLTQFITWCGQFYLLSLSLSCRLFYLNFVCKPPPSLSFSSTTHTHTHTFNKLLNLQRLSVKMGQHYVWKA